MQPVFRPEDWRDRLPLQPRYGRFSGDIVTGPAQLMTNLLLREELRDQFDWGEAVPIDIFVMAEGEAPDRSWTKIGGLPYRRASDRWPVGRDGEHMQFLGQINFNDSTDLLPELPGDVLLLFCGDPTGGFIELGLEWQPAGLNGLVTTDSLPKQPTLIAPCYGHRCRTVQFPAAEERDLETKYPICRGLEVWSSDHIPQMQGTMIGSAPFFIQEDPGLPGTIICAFSSVDPNQHGPYPWVNREEPLLPEDKWDFNHNRLMINDVGCIYVSAEKIGDEWNMYAESSSY